MSNDLISRSALISRIESERMEWGEDYDAEQILGDIEDMPTAYDPDKVVEQLEESKETYRKKRDNTRCRSTETDDCDRCRADHYLVARTNTIGRAIEIAKGGGVDV